MKSNLKPWARIVVATTFLSAPALQADQTIRCESHHKKHKFCRVDTHGYVSLTRCC